MFQNFVQMLALSPVLAHPRFPSLHFFAVSWVYLGALSCYSFSSRIAGTLPCFGPPQVPPLTFFALRYVPFA